MADCDLTDIPSNVSSTSLITYNFHNRLLKKFHKPVRKLYKRIPDSLYRDLELESKPEIDLSQTSTPIKVESQLEILNNGSDTVKEEDLFNRLSSSSVLEFNDCSDKSLPNATNDEYISKGFQSIVPFLLKPKSHLDYFDNETSSRESTVIKPFKSNIYSSSNISDKIENNPHSRVDTLVCDLCDFTCERSSDLRVHRREHKGQAFCVCKDCGYTCRRLTNLRTHRQIHTGAKPFACDKCSYTSNFINNLKSHKVIHSGEKPFSCSECSYICGRPSNLKRHMLKHSKEKPYPCDLCSYMSKDLTGLKVHKLTHSGQKPFSCDECSSSYITLKSLNHHKKKHNIKLESAVTN